MSPNTRTTSKRWFYLAGLSVVMVMAIAAAFVFLPLRTPPDDEAHVEMIAQVFDPPLRFPFAKLPPAPAEIAPILEKVNLERNPATWADFTKLYTQKSLKHLETIHFGEAEWKVRKVYRQRFTTDYYVFGVILLSSAKTRHAFVYGHSEKSSKAYTKPGSGIMVSPLVWDSTQEWLFEYSLQRTTLASYLSNGTYAAKYFLSQDHEGFQRKVPEIKHRYWTEFVRHEQAEKVYMDRSLDGTMKILGDSP